MTKLIWITPSDRRRECVCRPKSMLQEGDCKRVALLGQTENNYTCRLEDGRIVDLPKSDLELYDSCDTVKARAIAILATKIFFTESRLKWLTDKLRALMAHGQTSRPERRRWNQEVRVIACGALVA